MADNIEVGVNVTGNANQQLQQINKQAQALGKTFNGLKTALAGLAIGGFITNAYRGAEAIKDLSDATGFAVQSIIGIGRAFQENGSSIQAAQDSIAKFTKNVGEAVAGNASLQQSFEKVGVSLQDLATLSEEDLYLKTLKGLGQIADKAEQVRIASDLMGKGLRADFAGAAASVSGFISASAGAAQATITADKAAANFERAITNLQEQLLITLNPLSELAAGINTSSEAIGNFVKTAASIALVIASITALGRVVTILRNGWALLTEGVALASKGIQVIRENIGSLGKTLQVVTHYIGRFLGLINVKNPKNTLTEGLEKSFGYLKQEFPVIMGGLAKIGQAVAALGSIAATAFAFFKPDAILNAFKDVGQYLGILKDDVTEVADYIDKQLAEGQFGKTRAAIEGEEKAQRQVIDALEQKIKSIKQVSESYAQQNKEIIDAINNEARYLQMSDTEAETQKALDDLYKRTAGTIQDLIAQKDKLNATQVREKEAIDKTIASIDEQARADAARVITAIQNIQKEREAIEERNRAIEFGETLRKDTAALEQMQNEIDMLYMTTEERENYGKLLEAEANLKERLAEIDLEAAAAGRNVTTAMIEDWNRRREAAISYYNTEKELLEEYRAAQEDQSRQISVWAQETQQALQESISPASQVKTFWNGLSNQIDSFVKTGKFKVKDFLASLIQDFIAAQIKLQALNFMKSIFGGGGGLFGGKIIPGFLAEGGPAQAGKPYIVGEKGPELFVPRNSGTVIPNDQLGARATGTGQVNAPVTNNYITNNINALDAKSVAQLFAENRKTLLGSVKMAEREMPYMAR